MEGGIINIKQLFFIALLLLIVFSASAVSATNETVATDLPEESNNVTVDNASVIEIGNNSDTDQFDYANLNGISDDSEEIPQLNVALKSADESSTVPYIDISFAYKDYSVDINNKNYYFSINQDFKNNSIVHYNDAKLLNFATFPKKNGLFLDVNFLNMSHNDVELFAPDNFITYILNLFWSFFSHYSNFFLIIIYSVMNNSQCIKQTV